MELLTVCCRNGRMLLREDDHKQIVMNSLLFMVNDQRIWLYGFVILPDELHLLWKKRPDWEHRNVKQMMLKYTAQQFKRSLRILWPKELECYRSELRDREFQFWEQSAYITKIKTGAEAEEVLEQLHEVPVSSGLCNNVNDYPFSSSSFYHNGHDPHKVLTHYYQYFPP